MAIRQTMIAAAKACHPRFVQAIVRAHVWLKLLSDGTYDSIEAHAVAAGLTPNISATRCGWHICRLQ